MILYKLGLVSSFNHPGGNLTGVAQLSYSLGAKRLEILREVVPNAKLIGVLANTGNPDRDRTADLEAVKAAASLVGQQIYLAALGSEGGLESAFARIVKNEATALLVMADPVFLLRREKIINLAARYSIPAVYAQRPYAVSGGLLSYGSDFLDAWRQLGTYAAKIIAGASPSDLPITQSVKVELVLNLKTAKSLGIAFPLPLIGRADEVIE